MFRQIIASIKSRSRPPKWMFPWDMMREHEKLTALKTARRILSNPDYDDEANIKLSRWWVVYMGEDHP